MWKGEVSLQLVDAFFECSISFEDQSETGRNEPTLLGRRIDADTLHAFLHLKGSETWHIERGFVIKRVGYVLSKSIDHLLSLFHTERSTLGNGSYEVFVIHNKKDEGIKSLVWRICEGSYLAYANTRA